MGISTCTSRAQALFVNSPWVQSSANWASSFASAAKFVIQLYYLILCALRNVNCVDMLHMHARGCASSPHTASGKGHMQYNTESILHSLWLLNHEQLCLSLCTTILLISPDFHSRFMALSIDSSDADGHLCLWLNGWLKGEVTCYASWPESISNWQSYVILGTDVQDLIPVNICKVLCVVHQAQLQIKS